MEDEAVRVVETVPGGADGFVSIQELDAPKQVDDLTGSLKDRAKAWEAQNIQDARWRLIWRDEEGSLEIFTTRFYQAIFAEFLGTGLFVFIGILTIMGGLSSFYANPDASGAVSIGAKEILDIAFGFGIGLASMVFATADLSGGNLNPAVSVALFVRGKMSLLRTVVYTGTQMGGSTAAVKILQVMIPYRLSTGLGATTLSQGITQGTAVALEGLLTACLVYCVLATTYPGGENRGTAPLHIGLVVFCAHIFGIIFTGASLNPARSFGPAAISNNWTDQWVYWAGPIWGAVFMAVYYDLIFVNVFHMRRFLPKPKNLKTVDTPRIV